MGFPCRNCVRSYREAINVTADGLDAATGKPVGKSALARRGMKALGGIDVLVDFLPRSADALKTLSRKDPELGTVALGEWVCAAGFFPSDDEGLWDLLKQNGINRISVRDAVDLLRYSALAYVRSST